MAKVKTVKETKTKKNEILPLLKEALNSEEIIKLLEEKLKINEIKKLILSQQENQQKRFEAKLQDKVSKTELSEVLQSIKELTLSTKDEINKRFDEMHKFSEQRFQDMNNRFQDMNKRFDEMHKFSEKRFQETNARLDLMIKMYNKLFWVIVSFLTPLTLSIIGILWKIFIKS